VVDISHTQDNTTTHFALRQTNQKEEMSNNNNNNNKPQYRLLIENASQIVTVTNNANQRIKKGSDQNKIECIENGSLIVGHNGLIVAVGKHEDLCAKYNNLDHNLFETVIDARGKSVVPGLVDGHTHPVWSGDRTHEFSMKLSGATYMDIHNMGGGISFTVKHTRQTSEQELSHLLLKRLRVMLRNGSTLVEAKSGYGLNTETEMKMLKVIHSANVNHSDKIPMLVANYLGAHSVPKIDNLTMTEYTEQILNEQIPELIKLKQQGLIDPKLIDVFHEEGVFDTECTRKILLSGKEKAGLKINFHGDELHPMKSAELGAEVGAIAISHLEKISEEGIKQMAEKEICAVLLPTTAYVLRIEYPPARKLIESGVPVVLASDFNPNAHCMSLPFVMNLACVNMRMTMPEALVACTLNAAAALDCTSTHGSLCEGKYGDCVIVNSSNWEHLIYEIGNSSDSVINKVIKQGKIVVDNKEFEF
jgi:imidazolonepropionase